MSDSHRLTVAVAQLAPVVLDRERTIAKVVSAIAEAAAAGAALVAFGEAFVPCYPLWLSRTDAARWDDADQKALHARYVDQGVDIEAGHLESVAGAAREHGMTIVLGVMERPRDRGGHSLFASRVVIAPDGSIASVHRKLMPTYDERLAWSHGDAAGLVTHPLGPFTLSALNCWENWMPLARAALYAQGADLHVAIWPGSERNTRDITRFIATEMRGYVISASAIYRPEDVPLDVPSRDLILDAGEEWLQDGGSAIAGPDGEWVVAPVPREERIVTAEIDFSRVLGERQNFDPAGHYSRPDVLRLTVDRRRQAAAEFLDDEPAAEG